MTDQYLKDKRGIRYGRVSTDTRGNAIIYDKMNIRLGTIKIDSMGKLTAFDKMSRTIAVYDPKADLTKDKIGRRIGKGNTLLDLFFEHQ